MSKVIYCEKCVIGQFCTKSANETIIKECNNLNLSKRFKFANERGLVEFESIFTDVFWNLQDFKALLISIDLIKNTFENPEVINQQNKNFVKDQMFIEIIVKFCKLAEDFGGLASSKDQNLFNYALNFNKYGIGQAKSFYEDLSLRNENISKLFFYPPINKQNDEEKNNFLKASYAHLTWYLNLIREKYLAYVEVYNSYKHGYRIRFGDIPFSMRDNPLNNDFKDVTMNITDGKELNQYHGIAKYSSKSPHRLKGETKSNKILLFYNAKLLRKYPFCKGIVAYTGFNENNFYEFYDSSLALIKLLEMFLNNFMISIGLNKDKLLLLDSTDTKLKKFNINDFDY